MFCPNCGGATEINDHFCRLCGHNLDRTFPEPKPPKAKSSAVPMREPSQARPTPSSVRDDRGEALSRLQTTYAKMSDEELHHLVLKKQSLTDQARNALDAELSKRDLKDKALDVPAYTQAESLHASHPSLAQKGVRGPYTWLTVDLAIATFLLSVMVFNLAWQTTSDSFENVGESIGRTFFFVIILLYGANRAWKSLLAREPETNPTFKQRHRRFQTVAGTCIVLVVASALSFGVVAGQRIERNKRISTLLEQLKQQAPRNLEFRQRLSAIWSRETPTMEDYYSKCLAFEALLDEFEPQRRKNSLLLNSARTEWGDNERAAPTLELLGRIDELDSQFVVGLRKEIAAAKELWSLPPRAQEAFYKRKIMPIQAEVEAVANKQMLLLREAQQQGITLPSDISELLDED